MGRYPKRRFRSRGRLGGMGSWTGYFQRRRNSIAFFTLFLVGLLVGSVCAVRDCSGERMLLAVVTNHIQKQAAAGYWQILGNCWVHCVSILCRQLCSRKVACQSGPRLLWAVCRSQSHGTSLPAWIGGRGICPNLCPDPPVFPADPFGICLWPGRQALPKHLHPKACGGAEFSPFWGGGSCAIHGGGLGGKPLYRPSGIPVTAYSFTSFQAVFGGEMKQKYPCHPGRYAHRCPVPGNYRCPRKRETARLSVCFGSRGFRPHPPANRRQYRTRSQEIELAAQDHPPWPVVPAGPRRRS